MSEKPIEPKELTIEEGSYLVRISREAVRRTFFKEPLKFDDVPEKLRRKGAAFVTIETLYGEKRSLRGCIGFIEPIKPLYQTVIEAARAAAFEDPRFPPLRLSELPMITFEVSVLSDKKTLPTSPEERLKKVAIGEMGLIARKGFFSGLLLPQVPVEYGWDTVTFLMQTCIKAGLSPECWRDPSVEFYYFTARIFGETVPEGEIIEKKLK